MLEVFGLSHAYGRHKALDEVSIRLRAGEAVAILGANGAGKTTLINAIAGLCVPRAARSASKAMNWWASRLIALSRWELPRCLRTGGCSSRCR
jgi:ABC-type branched-subunit amino acid transport system ATPase component